MEVVMFFVIGVALAAVSAFLLGLCYIGGRNQKDSFWTNDFMMGSIYVPGIMMIMMLSLGSFYHMFKTFGTQPLTWAEWVAGIAVAVVSILAWQFTGLGRKIKACRQADNATVIQVDFSKEQSTTPPASEDKPGRGRAA
jgi:hypothetical protein